MNKTDEGSPLDRQKLSPGRGPENAIFGKWLFYVAFCMLSFKIQPRKGGGTADMLPPPAAGRFKCHFRQMVILCCLLYTIVQNSAPQGGGTACMLVAFLKPFLQPSGPSSSPGCPNGSLEFKTDASNPSLSSLSAVAPLTTSPVAPPG